MNFEGTLAKIGAKVEAIKSGPLKDMGSPFRELDAQARAVMQGMVNEYYQRFVGIVSAHRTIKNQDSRAIATDGRVFSGVQAVEMGLADKTGLLEDAIAEAKSLSGAHNAKVVLYKRPFGYSGSIYAQDSTQPPQANVTVLKIPGVNDPLPVGFYYLWVP
jgi:protease-4